MANENKLTHLKEFQELLKDYRVSKNSKSILLQTQLVLLTAATSSGRNTIIKELLKTGEYHFIISDTTRHPRLNNGVLERNGVEYWFRSEEEMLEDLRQGKFLEAEVIHKQQVSGISIRELKAALLEEKIAITDIDIGGIQNVVDAKPDTLAVLVLPPSFEEWKRRIMGRGEMSKGELKRRLETACRIFSTALEKPYLKFIINDDLNESASKVNYLARYGESEGDGQQEDGRQIAEQLYIETQMFLNSL
jgi:guanylate kinase